MPSTLPQRDLTLSEITDIDAMAPPDVGPHPYAGRRVRVVRILVYEGEGLDIGRQLAQSLSPGARFSVGKGITIDVHQREIEDLGPCNAPQPGLPG